MCIHIWFIGPTDCFTNIIWSLRCMKLKCSFHFTEKQLMHRKVMWIGGTAEQKNQTSSVLHFWPINYPWSIFIFVNPRTNSKCMEIFFFKSIHYYHPIFQTHSWQCKQLVSWQRANRWWVENILLFLPHYHTQNYLSLTSLYPG